MITTEITFLDQFPQFQTYSSVSSLSGREDKFLDLLEEEFGSFGYKVDRQKDCLVLRSDSSLIFSAHIDRVPCEPKPIVVDNGMIHGQLDNVISMVALRQLMESGYRPNIIFTTQEEIVKSPIQLIRNIIPGEKWICLDIDIAATYSEVAMGVLSLRDKDNVAPFNQGLVRELRSIAFDANIPYVTKDGEWIIFELGIATRDSGNKINGAGLLLPIWNYHSNKEIANCDAFYDWLIMLELICENNC